MVVQHAWDIMALFLIASMTTSESIKRKPQPEATEATAVPRPTGHSTAYAGGGASKKIMAVASPFFQPVRSVKRHENRGIDPKRRGYAQEIDSCTAVAVLRVSF